MSPRPSCSSRQRRGLCMQGARQARALETWTDHRMHAAAQPAYSGAVGRSHRQRQEEQGQEQRREQRRERRHGMHLSRDLEAQAQA